MLVLGLGFRKGFVVGLSTVPKGYSPNCIGRFRTVVAAANNV